MRKIKNIIYIVLGFISLGLGCIGIVFPILPTVPFLLLTSFCFVRGSDKFNNWFLKTKIYKNYLEGFVKNKMMTIKGEMILLSLVSLMLFASMWFVNNLVVSIILTILIMCKYLYFIFCIKTVSKEEYIEAKNKLKEAI